MSDDDERGRRDDGRGYHAPQPPQGPTWHSGQDAAGADSSAGPSTAPYGSPAPGEPSVYTYVTGPPPKRRRYTALVVGGVVLLALFGCIAAYLFSGSMAEQSTQSATQREATTWPTSPAPVQQGDVSAPDWTATAAAVSPSVVSITVTASSGNGQGSGVVLDQQGRVVTNYHVVAAGGQNGTILVTLNDKRTYQAKVVGSDPTTDLAVLQLANPPEDLRPVSMGSDGSLKVGAPVMAVGNPLGLAGTVTTGIVSALNRPVATQQQRQGGSGGLGGSGGEAVVTNAIQTSAAINPGNSGGALVNATGQLIGINSSIAAVSASTPGGGEAGNIGIGFAIPVDEVRSVAQQIITTGSVKHPFVGLTGRDGFAKEGSTQRAAAIVAQVQQGVPAVTAGSPAAKAGLRAGDAVVAVNGEIVDSWLSLVAQIREQDVGDTITLTIIRDGQRSDVKVTLAERPAD